MVRAQAAREPTSKNRLLRFRRSFAVAIPPWMTRQVPCAMMRTMRLSADLGTLAEIASQVSTRVEFERQALDVIGPRVGFDVAMFKRASGLGEYAPGLDSTVRDECRELWGDFGVEWAPVAAAAKDQRYVAVDVEVLGVARLESSQCYQRLMRPHGGKCTAMVYLVRQGCPFGALALGRTTRTFTEEELEYLRAVAPTLALCDCVLSPPRAENADVLTLTRREREVLDYLRLGLTNGQIALALGTAERTVRNQLSRVYEKLGVANRAEAVSVSFAQGH